MAMKLSLSATIGLLLLLFLLPLFFFLSNSPSFPLSFSPCPSLPSVPPPLKVFMYDLPSRFHVSMLTKRTNFTDGSLSFPPWPYQSGVGRQHSVEYFLMGSLLQGGIGGEIGVVRVLNGDEADVFFVPFFSSLSFNVHGHNMTDPDTEIDRQLQVDLLEILHNSKFYQKSAGRDHVIPMHHPNAFRFLRDSLNSSILIVSDFARLPMRVSYLRKDVVAPYVHVVESFSEDDPPDPFGDRTTLLFFRGRTVRKADGIVRAKLAKMLKGQKDVHFEDSLATGEGIKASTEGMRESKFCLSPAGDTPSSCRLFDAIASHCVPVIVSDRIELPFESELDYSSFALFFSSEEALRPGHLLGRLRSFERAEWVEMWRALKGVKRHFEYRLPARNGEAVDLVWREVRGKVREVKRGVNRSRRLKVPDWWGKR